MDNHNLLVVHCHETRKNLDDSTLQRHVLLLALLLHLRAML